LLREGKYARRRKDVGAKISVRIPVAVKVSPFFSNFANMAKRLD
jgi:hypothetical protein